MSDDTIQPVQEIRPLSPEEAALQAAAVQQIVGILLEQPTPTHALALLSFTLYSFMAMQIGPEIENDRAFLDQFTNSVMTMRHNAKHQNKTIQ